MSFIKDQLIKDVAKKLDSLVKLKGIAEVLDGVLFKFALGMLSDKFADKIDIGYQDEVILLLEAFVSEDYSKVTQGTVDVLNQVIEIPSLNEDEEGVLIGAIVQAIIKIILNKRK